MSYLPEVDARLFNGLPRSGYRERNTLLEEGVVKFFYRGRIFLVHERMVGRTDRGARVDSGVSVDGEDLVHAAPKESDVVSNRPFSWESDI